MINWVSNGPARWIILKTDSKRSLLTNVVLILVVVPALFLIFQIRGRDGSGPPEEPPLVISSGTIPRGGSLYKSLLKEGVADLEIQGLIGSLKRHFDPRRSRPGDAYELFKTTSGELVRLKVWEGPIQYYTVEKTTSGYVSDKDAIPLEDVVMGLSGSIENSLWDSMVSRGADSQLFSSVESVFAWQIDFLTEQRKGDRYKVLWKRKVGANGISLEGDILAAAYEGGETGNVVAVRFEGRYYDADGNSMERSFLRGPLDSARVSSFFNKRRYHPILRRYRPHHGTDYAAPRGTGVRSVGDGVVVYSGWKGGYGNVVKIRHTNSSFETLYGHLQYIRKGITAGRRVGAKQIIGAVGSTGLATGPHLHFEVHRNGVPINFLTLKLPPSRKITDPGELARFNKLRDVLLRHLDSVDASAKAPVPIDSGFAAF